MPYLLLKCAQEFNSASFSEATLSGGNYSAFDLLHYQQWSASIGGAPTQVSIQLQNITALISDPTRRLNLQNHIDSYVANYSVSEATTTELIVQPIPWGGDGYESSDAVCPSGSFLTGITYYGEQDDQVSCSVNCTLGFTSTSGGNINACNCNYQVGYYPCPENQFVASFSSCYPGFLGQYARYPLLCCSICYQPQVAT